MAVASTRSTPSDDVSLELAKDVVTASETADSEKLGHEEAGESVREYPRGSQLWLVSIALYVGGFLICLDATALGAAVPVITTDFGSLDDIGWYNSVYFMAMSTPQLLFNKLNECYPIRWNYTVSMLLFVAGSAVCGATPNSPVLIFGRGLAGLGAAGLIVTTSALLPFLTPPAKRPMWIGLFAASMGLGTSSGPLISGALTQDVSWRWNAGPSPSLFYINIPLGVATSTVLLLLIRAPPPAAPVSALAFLRSVDLLGLATLTPCIVCLMLALQMGGTAYAWGSGRVIALFVLSGLFAAAFLGSEIWQGNRSIVPIRILKQRTVLWTMLYAFVGNSVSVATGYYLPIWFQGAKEYTPLQSGVDTLPQVVSTVVGSFLSGILITMFGHIGTLMLAATALTAIGTGLLSSLDVDASSGKWIAYQIIFGLGSGISRQTPTVAVQQVVDPKDVPMAYTLITFVLFLSPSIFVSAGQSIFANTLIGGLEGLGAGHIDPSAVLNGGVKTITDGLPDAYKRAALNVFNDSVVHVWRMCLVLSGVGFLAACGVEHRKIRAKGKL